MVDRPRVLVTSWLVQEDDPALQILRDAGCEVVMGRSPRPRSAEDMSQAVRGIDGIVAGSDNYSAAVIEAADRLKTIVRVGVGYDTVDLAAATSKGVQVGTTPGTNHHAVADYAFGLLLASARRIVQHHTTTAAGQWVRMAGPDVYGKTIGIVGLGAIGKGVARRARGFDMEVLAYDVYQDEAFAQAVGVRYVEMDELFQRADYVTLHTPLLPETRGLVNAERIRTMKPTAYLINTARGELVDLDALAAAVEEGRLAGAALDVFPKEPPTDHPILRTANVIVSPHVAGGSIEANLAAARMACESVVAAIAGQRVAHCVNPDVYGTTFRTLGAGSRVVDPGARTLPLYWVVVLDRGRVSAPRGFAARDEAVVFATLHMAAERVEIVAAASAEQAIALAQRGRPGPGTGPRPP